MTKDNVYTLLIAFIAALTLWTSPAWAEKQQPDDQKIAVINDTVITRAELDQNLTQHQRRLAAMGKTLNAAEKKELKNRVLDDLIARVLLYQESQKSGIEVAASEVNAQLDQIKKQFDTEDAFKKALSSMNLDETGLKSQLQKELAVRQLVEERFGSKIAVSDKETKQFYDTHPEAFHRPGEVKASHILIKVDPAAEEAQKKEALEKTREIQEKIKQGADFAELAKVHSKCPSASKGGDLGSFKRGQMVKPFEDAAFALEPGQVSDIVETRFGYHLIRCTDKKSEKAMDYEKVKDTLKEQMKQRKLQEQMVAYIEELKKDAKVEVLR